MEPGAAPGRVIQELLSLPGLPEAAKNRGLQSVSHPGRASSQTLSRGYYTKRKTVYITDNG